MGSNRQHKPPPLHQQEPGTLKTIPNGRIPQRERTNQQLQRRLLPCTLKTETLSTKGHSLKERPILLYRKTITIHHNLKDQNLLTETNNHGSVRGLPDNKILGVRVQRRVG